MKNSILVDFVVVFIVVTKEVMKKVDTFRSQ